MRRKLSWAFAILAVMTMIAAPLWGPRLLRQVAWFRVANVEISGTRLLTPGRVLAASGIRADQNIWDDPGVWRERLLQDSAIADVAISRDLPGTLHIQVTEKRPIAYVEDGALEPVTALGEVLPIDPALAPMDLPIIGGPWRRTPPATRRVLLDEIVRLTRLDPGLIADVSEIRVAGPAAQDLVLSHRLGDIILPVGAGPDRLAELHAVLTDLAVRLSADGLPASGARLDLRYDQRVIVRLPTSA